MNRNELIRALIADRIRSDTYDLNGGHLPERYTLGESNGRWYVYYSERGEESGKKFFNNEHDACDHFYNLIKKDPLVRK